MAADQRTDREQGNAGNESSPSAEEDSIIWLDENTPTASHTNQKRALAASSSKAQPRPKKAIHIPRVAVGSMQRHPSKHKIKALKQVQTVAKNVINHHHKASAGKAHPSRAPHNHAAVQKTKVKQKKTNPNHLKKTNPNHEKPASFAQSIPFTTGIDTASQHPHQQHHAFLPHHASSTTSASTLVEQPSGTRTQMPIFAASPPSHVSHTSHSRLAGAQGPTPDSKKGIPLFFNKGQSLLDEESIDVEFKDGRFTLSDLCEIALLYGVSFLNARVNGNLYFGVDDNG